VKHFAPPAAVPVLVTANTLDEVSRGLPFTARESLRLASKLSCGQLDVHLPDGRFLRFCAPRQGPSASMIIHNFAFTKSMIWNGDIGLAESYLRGEWDTPDLTRFMELFVANKALIKPVMAGKALLRLWNLMRHMLNRNTRQGARRNIHAHYDLGNPFYEAWLDESMTYSSGLFTPDDPDLANAQKRKYQALARDTGLAPHHHVLEIGCGWGGFAEFAAKDIGCHVTAITISKAQHDYARKRIHEAGLNDKVDVKLQDYRDETGFYDRVVSIEMFEAVGESFWDVYFQQLRDRLKPQGQAGLQVITIQDEHFSHYRRHVDFIRRYIFPGGMLPSPQALKQLGARFGIPLQNESVFGLDYARTLAVWRERFHLAWPQLTSLGFDERFRRMWHYYLSYCEAGFRSRNIDVRHMVFVKG
jgi:cyclopropane-fatty-acyl-phospholipid synthase